ncbi:MAG: hypothetical protein HQ518_02825 [Rhodopirellula sp.]|nr:hypothetical protein [Rhodopirellula sp.]
MAWISLHEVPRRSRQWSQSLRTRCHSIKRIWIAKEKFGRRFEVVEWAVMFILAKGGETCARLRFNVGPQSSQEMNVEVDYSRSFEAGEVENKKAPVR